ncbi:MAG: DUF4160 domain-containing protein [Pseudomonadota bacterium]
MFLLKTKGIRLRIFNFDHEPPHVHVAGDSGWAKIEIEEGSIIEGHIGTGELKKARRAIKDNRARLLLEWEKAQERGKKHEPRRHKSR